MHEINQEVFLRQAKLDHSRLLKESHELSLIRSARPYTPGAWDAVTLNLGNWLIKLGNNLKDHSVYTQLSEKHA
jgi:hypothetical protein